MDALDRPGDAGDDPSEGRMSATEFRSIRQGAGLSFHGLANLLRYNDVRTLRRYEKGSQDVSGPVSLLMEMLRDGRL